MKTKKLLAGSLLCCLSLMPLSSCIGSFSLTNKVLNWNHRVGSKFLDEVVFFAFWVLPVYEVTAIADLLVINSIEFWSGSNPMVEAYTKTVETEHGNYIVVCDKEGYTVTDPSGKEFKLLFDENEQSWSLELENNETYPLFTFIDENHVRLDVPGAETLEFDISNRELIARNQ